MNVACDNICISQEKRRRPRILTQSELKKEMKMEKNQSSRDPAISFVRYHISIMDLSLSHFPSLLPF